MASEHTETHAGNRVQSAPATDANEHDYAHTADGGFAPAEAPPSSGAPAPRGVHVKAEPEPFVSSPAELPEPAVGAEVDCPGGSETEPPSLSLSLSDDDPPKPPVTGTASTARRGRRRVNRPEDVNCAGCRSEFEKQGRCFCRRAVYTFTNPETVQWVFPDSVVNDKSFLCETCAQVVRSRCKRKHTGKRYIWLKPPEVKQSQKRKKGRRMGKKSKAALLVSKSCYKAAFKMLWSAKGARKPMMEFWSKQLKEEMKALSRQADSPFHQKVSNRKPLTSFPWRRCLTWAQDKAPLVTTCLRSLFPDINALSKSSHQVSEEQAQMLLERRTVVTLSVPLFTRNIWKNNFLQAALGAELRLQGCAGSALDALNTMGLCQNKDTVRLLLHRLQNGEKTTSHNRHQRMMMTPEQLKGEALMDGEDEEEDVEKEEEEGEDDEEEMAEEEEVEEEEVQDGVQEDEEEEEDQVAEEEEKRRKKNVKKQRKEQKRKQSGKRKANEREEDEGEEGSVQKKNRVVVVRLGLLKGHSEVGLSDLSAP